MNEYILRNDDLNPLAADWLKHEFYRNAVVLGIDIGLEGIGLYLRRGQQEVFARSLLLELPEAEALAGRRQKRAWRHCRKNRKRRLHRLKLLFQKHGLPWLDAGRMSRAHPFRERHRAINGGVASKNEFLHKASLLIPGECLEKKKGLRLAPAPVQELRFFGRPALPACAVCADSLNTSHRRF